MNHFNVLVDHVSLILLTSGAIDADGQLLEADPLALGNVCESLAQVPRRSSLHGA